jgi:hypothetical protein
MGAHDPSLKAPDNPGKEGSTEGGHFTGPHVADNRRTVKLDSKRSSPEKTRIALIYLLTVKIGERSIQPRVVESGRKWVQPR